MKEYYYDLHMHSCLSPCADNDNTPGNLVGMGVLAGLTVMALTDHNTCRNCPSFFAAAEQHGIVPVAGMELTTAEDIHMVCLFETLEAAMAFSEEIDRRRIRIPNRTDIFGEQWVCDATDTPCEQEPDLLSNATTVSLEEGEELVARFGGVYYPAHIDREANGIIATLGMLPPTPHFTCVEFKDGGKVAEYRERYGLDGMMVVIDSDAHYLWDVQEKVNAIALSPNDDSDQAVRTALIHRLKQGGDVL